MKNQMKTIYVVLLISGCGASPQQLRTRAAFDLGCPEETLVVKELDSGTRLVTGCRRQAIYVELYNNSRHSTWLLNSDIKPVPEVAGRQ